MWDEASTFLSSFGLYKGSGTYDRSIFLELANGYSEFKRDLKQARCNIKQPRLNMCLLGSFSILFCLFFLIFFFKIDKGHPSQFIDILKTERAQKDDGLIQRFIICAPQPSFYKSKDILDAPVQECSLVNIFMFISIANKDNKVYYLSPEAEKLFCRYFDEYRQGVENSYKVDSFIRY